MKVLFNNIAKEIEGKLNVAQSKIHIAMAWFTNESLFNLLCDKLKSGVAVDLIIINDEINNNTLNGLIFQRFVDQGGRLYFGSPENLMHHKFCIIDDQFLINGSYNWTYAAESKNLENTIIHNDTDLILRFQNEFLKIRDCLDIVTKVGQPFKTEEFRIDGFKRNSILEELELKSTKYESLGDYKKALELTKSAFELSPENKKVENQLKSLIAKEEESHKASFIPLPTAVEDPIFDAFNKHLKNGKKAYKSKKFTEAINSLKQALNLKPEYAELYFWIGLCEWKMQKYPAVITSCELAIKLNPNYYLAYNLIGISKYELGNVAEAINHFNKSIALNSNFYKSHFNLGLAFKKLNNKTQAKVHVNRSLAIINELLHNKPLDIEAIAIRADILSFLGNKSSAKTQYESARKIFANSNSDKDLNLEERINNGETAN